MVFLVHGGGWRHGDKAHERLVQNKVARWVPRGVVLVSVNYRLLPEAGPDEQLRDVARALATAQRQAPGWGADPQRFLTMGHSAGAHLVALLAAT
ncbi:LipQ, partial [Acidovorax delafieldii 2AN]